MTPNNVGGAPDCGTQQGEPAVHWNTDYQPAENYLDEQTLRMAAADLAHVTGYESWMDDMPLDGFPEVNENWDLENLFGRPGSDLTLTDTPGMNTGDSVDDPSPTRTPLHSSIAYQSTPLTDLSACPSRPQANDEIDTPSKQQVNPVVDAIVSEESNDDDDGSDNHSVVQGKKDSPVENEEAVEDLLAETTHRGQTPVYANVEVPSEAPCGHDEVSPRSHEALPSLYENPPKLYHAASGLHEAHAGGPPDLPDTSAAGPEQGHWADLTSNTDVQPFAPIPQQPYQNIRLDALGIPPYLDTTVPAVSQDDGWLLNQPLFHSTTPDPWLQQAGAQATHVPQVQANMAGPQANLGLDVPGQRFPKSHEELKQVERQLKKIAYPTTLDDVPALRTHEPLSTAHDPYYDAENPEDRSSFTLGETDWSIERPPPVLGMLDPPPAHSNLARMAVGNLADARGRELRHAGTGFPIRNIPCMPRYLSSQVSELHVEALMRLDPRVGYSDFRSRQPGWMAKQSAKEINALNNRRARRVRIPLNTRCWSGKYSDRPTKTLVQLLDELSDEQIEANTTWVVTPDGRGIHPPNNPGYVLDKAAFKAPKHKMSAETQAGMQKLEELRAKAVQWGLDHWSKLPREELPREWSMRQQGKRKRKEEPVTTATKRKVEEDEAGDEADEEFVPRPAQRRRRN